MRFGIIFFIFFTLLYSQTLENLIKRKSFIILQPKVYFVEKLIIKHPVTIIGNGATIKRTKHSTSKFLLKIESSYVTLKGIIFDSNIHNRNPNNVIFIKSGNVVIENCEVKNAHGLKGYGNGIVLKNYNVVKNIIINGSIIKQNEENGIIAQGVYNLKILNSQILQNKKNGIYLNYFGKSLEKKIRNVYILNNIISYNKKSGISCGTFIKNRDVKNRKYGYNDFVHKVYVGNNIVENNGYYGINFNCTDSILFNNIIRFNGFKSKNAAGVLINNGNSLVTDNMIINNYKFGIDAGGSTNLIIQNNRIENEKRPAIIAGGSKNCIIKGNIISGSINIKLRESTGDGEKFPYKLNNLIIFNNIFKDVKLKIQDKENIKEIEKNLILKNNVDLMKIKSN